MGDKDYGRTPFFMPGVQGFCHWVLITNRAQHIVGLWLGIIRDPALHIDNQARELGGCLRPIGAYAPVGVVNGIF